MFTRLAIATFVFLGTACDSQIGDSCTVSSDCGQTGERICDPDSNSPGGYCTIFGCDFDTCPGEAVCVRFFPSASGGVACERATEDSTDDCTLDEVCTLAGYCALRTAEVRYCMRACDTSGDCRDEYECRTDELMRAHGGEPVLADTDSRSELPGFCAARPLE